MNYLKKEIGNHRFKVINIEDEKNIKKLHLKGIPLFHIYKNQNLIEEIFGTYKNIEDIIRLHF